MRAAGRRRIAYNGSVLPLDRNFDDPPEQPVTQSSSGDDTLAFLLPRLGSFGERTAVIAFEPGGQPVVNYAELEDQAMRLAGGLLARGVTPGEPIALFADNSPEWIAVRLALLAVGALAVPLDYLLTEAQLAAAVADCGARRLFTTREHLAAASAAGVSEIYLLDGEIAEPGAESLMSLLGERPDSLPHPAPEDVVALFYTSGTTGAPKGVPLSQRNLAINVATLMALATEMADGSIGPDDRVLLPLPLHHSYPFIVGMLVPLASGATIVLPEGWAGPRSSAPCGTGGYRSSSACRGSMRRCCRASRPGPPP